MANTYDTAPKNFALGAEKSITKYLDLAGLTSFWGRVKAYVDTQDEKLKTALNTKVNTTDTTLRSYIESLTVNGIEVTPSASVEGGKNDSLAVAIDGSHIVVGPNGGDTYNDGKVDAAIAGLDSRLGTVEAIVTENVVNDLDVVDAPSGEGTKNFVDAKIEFTGSAATGDRKGTITIDETALDNEIATINEKIVDLQANAGVTNIGVKDVDSDTPNLVSIKLTGTKASTLPESAPADWDEATNGSWADYKANFEAKSRGDVLITLDETELENRLDEADVKLTGEIADRKWDVASLAGSGYEASTGGKADGDWKKTGENYNVKYRSITDLSERLAAIDQNLVTTINVVDTPKGEGAKNYVSFTKADSAASGDNSVTLTVDETALDKKLAEIDGNLEKLDDASVNGKALFTVTKSGDAITVAGQQVVLTTVDINRPSNDSLEDTLTGYDTKIAALATAVNFRGVATDKADALTKIVENGDFIIIGDKEYVYYDERSEAFGENYEKDEDYLVELGDTTIENQRISALENWVDTNFITADEIKALNAVGDGDVWTGPNFNLD